MKIIPTILIILFPILLTAQTYTVKQDGTGDYTTIQGAIDSLPGNDTILVWPGTYYENLEMKYKQFVLGSLTMTTGDESYTAQTVIDGSFQGRCLYVDSCNFAEINGFTLQHGKNYGAAGIWIFRSNCNIKNNIIKENYSDTDVGGIGITLSNVYLSNTSIHHNKARKSGGGLFISRFSNVVFDSVNRCNIYFNYAAYGTDIYKISDIPASIYLDTLIVDHLERYYVLSQHYPSGSPLDDITLYVNYGYLQTVSSDLYVSPNGSNDNPGTSPGEPLKNIWYALLKADPDTITRQNIFLLPGVFSDSSNNDWFPLGFRSNVNIIGSGTDTTILDAENVVYHFYGAHAVANNYSLKNLSLINGSTISTNWEMETGSIFINVNSNVLFENLLFKHNHQSYSTSGIRTQAGDSIILNNCVFEDSETGPFVIAGYWDPDDPYLTTHTYLKMTSCKMINHRPYPQSEYTWSASWAYLLTGTTTEEDTLTLDIIGCLFAGNKDSTRHDLNVRGVLSFNDVTANFVNCTFADNIAVNSQTGASFNVGNDSKINVYNSIFYKNEPLEIGLYKNYYPPYTTPDLSIYNSLVWGGEDSFFNPAGIAYYYDTTNLDTDPLFYGGAEFPYNLSDESPCIDAGTLDLPQFILDNMPDTDLAGNPRIFNGKIDMGAYEWNPTVSTKEIPNFKKQIPGLTAAPNPFTTQTTISAKWDNPARINIEIYNNAGLLIKTLQSGSQPAGSCKIFWDGTDDTGNYLPAGVYVVVLRVEGKEVGSVKVVKE